MFNPLSLVRSQFAVALRSSLLFVALFLLAACGGSSSSSSSDDSSDGEGNAFSVSGRVSIENYADVDSDVEERSNFDFNDANNSFAEAQYVLNPVKLGGYLSGTSGEFLDAEGVCAFNCVRYEKDLLDVFELRMSANQSVSLSVFPADDFDLTASDNIDLDLVLFERIDADTRNEVDRIAFSESQTQTLTVPSTADYYIVLEGSEDVGVPVLYTLSVSQNLQGSAVAGMPDLSAAFVPGEVLVRYRDSVSEKDRNGVASRQFSIQSQGMHEIKRLGSKARLFRISDQTMSQALSFEKAGISAVLPPRQQKKWQTLELIKQLVEQEDVEYAEPNYLYRASAITPNDPRYPLQWSLPLIDAPSAWELSTGIGTTIAVIDTGVDPDHLDLNDNLLPGYDFIRDAANADDGNNVPDNDPTDTGPSQHGGHVAGIAAAEGNNARGIAGVAFDAQILPLRTLGVDGTGSVADIADAIYYAAGRANSSGLLLAEPVDVINLSLGSESDSQTFRNAINAALAEGVIIVAAAGNSGTSTPEYPAAYSGVIAVSSVDSDREKSSFSNFGSHIDVAAPGGFDGFGNGILSTLFASQYGQLVGTSMATPHVAGVAALMKSLYPAMDASEFASILASGQITDNLGNPVSYYGSGLINAAKAVSVANSLAGGGGEISPSLNVFPGSFGFVGGDTSDNLNLSNPGSGTVSILSVTSPVDWLNIAPVSVDGDGLGRYLVQVDYLAIPVEPTLTTSITIEYQIEAEPVAEEVVEVFVSRLEQEGGTVGNLYVYLLQESEVEGAEESDEIISVFRTVVGVLDDGEYTFNFTDVPAGRYYLEASTDNDGDYFVFDQGEAKGAYPLLFENEYINVTGSGISGLEFTVQYQNFAESSVSVLGSPQDTVQLRSLRQALNKAGTDSGQSPVRRADR